MPDDHLSTDRIQVPESLPIEPSSPDGKSKSELADLYNEKQKVLHWIYVIGIRLAFTFVCIVFAIRIYHFVTPYSWQWLCEHQLQVLDKFLFSGVIGALIGKNFDKVFKDLNKE